MLYDITINYSYVDMLGPTENTHTTIKGLEFPYPIIDGMELNFKGKSLGKVTHVEMIGSGVNLEEGDWYSNYIIKVICSKEGLTSFYFDTELRDLYEPWKKQKESEKYAKAHPILSWLDKTFS